jgi:hypothetical protein
MGEKAEDYPAIAALGYAVGALDSWKPVKAPLPDRQQTNYNLFSYQGRA